MAEGISPFALFCTSTDGQYLGARGSVICHPSMYLSPTTEDGFINVTHLEGEEFSNDILAQAPCAHTLMP